MTGLPKTVSRRSRRVIRKFDNERRKGNMKKLMALGAVVVLAVVGWIAKKKKPRSESES